MPTRPALLSLLAWAAVLTATPDPGAAQARVEGGAPRRPLRGAVSTADGTTCARPCVGPASGAVLAAGGGMLGPEIYERFVELAGGPGARVVVIPTASADDGFRGSWAGVFALRRAGAVVTVLHTRDRKVANADYFVRPLQEASGVWFTGGRQWRLVDAYLGTRTQEELYALLERGGVVGGTSAGASILASYLVRGSTKDNRIVMAPGYEEGFGLLRGVAVDQHLLARGREHDLLEVLGTHPDLLGIGLDEGTAIVVRGDRAEVLGRSKVAVYNLRSPRPGPMSWLAPGDVYDLGARRPIGAHGAAPPPWTPVPLLHHDEELLSSAAPEARVHHVVEDRAEAVLDPERGEVGEGRRELALP